MTWNPNQDSRIWPDPVAKIPFDPKRWRGFPFPYKHRISSLLLLLPSTITHNITHTTILSLPWTATLNGAWLANVAISYVPLAIPRLLAPLTPTLQNTTDAYCSAKCRGQEQPPAAVNRYIDDTSDSYSDDDILCYHEIHPLPNKSHWVGNGSAGIAAWAANVSPGAPSIPLNNIYRSTSAYLAPKLLLPHKRPIAPTLSMSVSHPEPPHPSLPILTPQQHMATLSLSSSGDGGSTLTDPFIATPSSASVPHNSGHYQNGVLGALATHVKSWVKPTQPSPPSSTHKKPRVVAKHVEPSIQKFRSDPVCVVSPSLSSDGSSDDDYLWVAPKAAAKDKSSRAPPVEHPRGRLAVEIPLAVRDDHPAYRSRGRKLSRAC